MLYTAYVLNILIIREGLVSLFYNELSDLVFLWPRHVVKCDIYLQKVRPSVTLTLMSHA